MVWKKKKKKSRYYGDKSDPTNLEKTMGIAKWPLGRGSVSGRRGQHPN